MRAVALEQRAQRVGELDPDRDVVAGVGPEALDGRAGDGSRRTPGCSVITRPSSHDIRAISSSMCRRNATASAGGGLAGERRAVDARRLGGPERVGAHVGVAVVGRDRAVGDEVPAALLQRAHVAGVVAGVDLRRLTEPGDRVRASPAARARGSDRAGTSGSRAAPTSGRRPARRARPGRRTGRRWWRAPRCGTARTAPAGGRRPAARRPAIWS